MIEWRRRFNEADTTDLRQAVALGLFVVLSTLLCARLVLLESIRSVDEALFAKVVPRLQESETLVSTSEWLTDMGSKNVAYILVVPLAAYLLAVRRQAGSALLVVTTLVATLGLQWLTFATVTGTTPTEFVIGTGGPFYSGGVVRAMIVAGMLVSTLTRQRSSGTRVVWVSALFVGVLEALTRLVLGRHWPLDIAAAIPIGAGILWCYLAMERWLTAQRRSRQMSRSAPDVNARERSTA